MALFTKEFQGCMASNLYYMACSGCNQGELWLCSPRSSRDVWLPTYNTWHVVDVIKVSCASVYQGVPGMYGFQPIIHGM